METPDPWWPLLVFCYTPVLAGICLSPAPFHSGWSVLGCRLPPSAGLLLLAMLLGRLALSLCLLSLWPLRTRSGPSCIDTCLPVRHSLPAHFAPPLFILTCSCPPALPSPQPRAGADGRDPLCLISLCIQHPWSPWTESSVLWHRPSWPQSTVALTFGPCLSLCVFSAPLASLVVAICSTGWSNEGETNPDRSFSLARFYSPC